MYCKDHREKMIEVNARTDNGLVTRYICPVCDSLQERLNKSSEERIRRLLEDDLEGSNGKNFERDI
jgi:hypothetical protein